MILLVPSLKTVYFLTQRHVFAFRDDIHRVGRLQLKWKGILVDGLTTVILVGGQQLLYAPCDSVRGPSSAFFGGCTRFVFTSALVFYEYFIISLLFLTYYNFKL